MTADAPDTEDDLLAQVDSHAYVQLSTFRRDGSAVPTPVWVARSGRELVVITNDGVGKVKRVRRDGRVVLRPCDVRGRVDDGAPAWEGSARLTQGQAELERVQRAIGAKYRLARLGQLYQRLVSRIRPVAPRRGIIITLGQDENRGQSQGQAHAG